MAGIILLFSATEDISSSLFVEFQIVLGGENKNFRNI